MKKKDKKKLGKILPFAVLGAGGTAFQNVVAILTAPQAVATLLQLKGIVQSALTMSKAITGLLYGIAVGFGGICGGLVNAAMNFELLSDFFERFVQSKKSIIPKNLTKAQNLRYYGGSLVFIITGLLFGMTAFAFGMTGFLAIAGIVVGVIVSAIMLIQELETWLSSFDGINNGKNPPLPLFLQFLLYFTQLTPKKILPLVITLTNVMGLSLLFTLGLFCFLTMVGVAALPALVIGFAFAFSFGLFTEFYFYNSFISSYCEKFSENWNNFKKSPLWGLGLGVVIVNAVVNVGLTISGIVLLSTLVASMIAPPLGVVLGIAIVAGLGAGLASGILGLNFWPKITGKIQNYFNRKKENTEETKSLLLSHEKTNSLDDSSQLKMEKKKSSVSSSASLSTSSSTEFDSESEWVKATPIETSSFGKGWKRLSVAANFNSQLNVDASLDLDNSLYNNKLASQ